MKRFTAMRTAKIASAIAAPLMVMIWYLTYAHEWNSDYWLYLLGALLLITMTPALCADPVAEDEAARGQRGRGFDGLIFAAVILISSGVMPPGLMVPLLVASFLSFYSMKWCIKRSAGDAAARSRRGDGLPSYFIAVGIGLSTGLVIYWLLGRPEAGAFFATLRPRLRGWMPTTAVALLCLHLMRVGLRKALAFHVTDLYPHLRRAEKTEA